MQAARRDTGEAPELAGQVWLVGEPELGGDQAQGRRIFGAYRPQRLLEPRQPGVALQSEADLTTEQYAQRPPVRRKRCGDGGNAVSPAQSALHITDQLGGAVAGAVCPGNQGPFERGPAASPPLPARRRVLHRRPARLASRLPSRPHSSDSGTLRSASESARRTEDWPQAAGPEHHPDNQLLRYRLDQTRPRRGPVQYPRMPAAVELQHEVRPGSRQHRLDGGGALTPPHRTHPRPQLRDARAMDHHARILRAGHEYSVPFTRSNLFCPE